MAVKHDYVEAAVDSSAGSAVTQHDSASRLRLPCCLRCGAKTRDLERFMTKKSNRNGNADRPYLKCMACNKFVTWLDARGIKDDNPNCECGQSSRLQISGKYGATLSRGLHFVCSLGACDFYRVYGGFDEDRSCVKDELLDIFVALKIV